jgi:hypothetical protein
MTFRGGADGRAGGEAGEADAGVPATAIDAGGAEVLVSVNVAVPGSPSTVAVTV